jgi:hypothetical protein
MSARIPRSWASAFHPQAARRGNQLNYRPGYQGSGQQPMTRVPVQAYKGKISTVPLTGGQAQGLISAAGKLTLTKGPVALGTVWYPAQVTLSTTTGPLDSSTALVYLGSQGIPITLVGSVFTGNGTVALAIPNMTPGQTLIVIWSNGHSGDTAAFNIIGTMDALTTGSG